MVARFGEAVPFLRNTFILLVWLASSAAVPAHAQTKAPTELAHWEYIKPLFPLVEQVAAGTVAPDDVALAWSAHFLKAEAGVILVPFTVQIDPAIFTSYPLAMYLRVVFRGEPAPAPGPRDALAQYPFEDAAIVDRPQDGRISRAFVGPPGEYDVYIALGDKPDPLLPNPRTVVIKQEVDVPDIGEGLGTSSIVLVERVDVDPRNRRLNFEEQLDEPYALWGSKLTPALRTTFGRDERLSMTFLVYNPEADETGKPNLEVQYSFFLLRSPSVETFFTRTRPELLNEETLGSGFNLMAGDLAIGGRQIPLEQFPDGNYRLEVTVIDKMTKESVTRRVDFTVAGP